MGLTAQFFYAGSCPDPDVIKTGVGGADGAYVNSELLSISIDDAQVKTYLAQVQNYSPKTATSGFPPNGALARP